MIHPRVREIALEDLDALPDPCRGCMFWQSHKSERGGEPDLAGQDAWWRAVQLDWGVPGRGIWDGDRLVAYAVFAPPLHVQRIRALPYAASDDALLVLTMWTDPSRRRAGHARHLLQVIAREAIAHEHAAVEAFGGGTPNATCILSDDVLLGLGFQVRRPHPKVPLYRLDLDRTIRWPSMVGNALGEVLSSLHGRERSRARPALERSGPADG